MNKTMNKTMNETRKYCFMFSKRYLTSSNLRIQIFISLFYYNTIIILSFIRNIFLQSKIEQIVKLSHRMFPFTLREITYNFH